MASPQRGKYFFLLLYLLFLSAYLHLASVLVKSESLSIEVEHEQNPHHESAPQTMSRNEINQPDLLIKLEELVRNLSDIVTRLESKKLLEPKEMIASDEKLGFRDSQRKHQISIGSARELEQQEGFQDKVLDAKRAKGVPYTKYSPFWSERFQFLSAVRLDSDATCINVLPFRDYEGLSKYVAVGDGGGRVYVLLRNGDVLVQFDTLIKSPITAMLSYMSAYKNESVIVTGHRNGAILTHRIWEGSSGEDWNSLVMENVGSFVLPEGEENDMPVTTLEVHHVGRMRYILSADNSGKIKVFLENGTLYGSAVPRSRPLVFLKQRLLFLTETGAGSIDLRNMKVRESNCEGLNQSLAQNYVFDATERSKAYGVTSEGEIFYVLLLGDIMNFKCRVRSKRNVDMDQPLALQAIKGYFLIVTPEKVFVYNVSSQHYVRVGLPRDLFSSSIDEIKSSFLNYPSAEDGVHERNLIPLIASDHEKLVVLGLGGGYVGIYRSNLPVFKGEFNTMLWTSPVLFFILFLFVAWHFFAKKKEALTSWGPDDPFSSTSATAGAPLVAGAGERTFADSSSRSSEMMELRSGLRGGPSGRYVSPSGYAGGTTSSFRPNSTDHNPRPASIDPDFRAASELKYRGSAMESSNFANRRDNLFVGSQIVDDRN